MQYYIHSHGFGNNNTACLSILLKGLRNIDINPRAREAWSPVVPAVRPDNTRIDRPDHPFARPVSSLLANQLHGRSSPSQSPVRTGAEIDPNAGLWGKLSSGQGARVHIAPGIVVQQVSEMGANQRDYFVFSNLRMAEVTIASKQTH